jgi:hypothetical protein
MLVLAEVVALEALVPMQRVQKLEEHLPMDMEELVVQV